MRVSWGVWPAIFSVNDSPSFFQPNDVVDHVLVKVWKHSIQRSAGVLAQIAISQACIYPILDHVFVLRPLYPSSFSSFSAGLPSSSLLGIIILHWPRGPVACLGLDRFSF